MAPLTYIQTKYKFSKTQTFRYPQLRHALIACIEPDMETMEDSLVERKLLNTVMQKKAMSQTYATLMINTPRELMGKRPGTLDDDMWVGTRSPGESLKTSTFRLVHLKILHRIYCTKGQLHRYRYQEMTYCCWDRTNYDIPRGTVPT